MPITTLPLPPSRSDSVNFAARGDAFMTALPVFATELNALESNVNAKEASVSTQASSVAINTAAAISSANAAAASAGAALWVSSTNYALGAVVWSPVNKLTYRRIVAGVTATDPSADTTNWALAAVGQPQMVISATTQNNISVNQHIVLTHAALSTATLPAAPAGGDVVWVGVGNGRTDNVIARNGLLIMGLAEDMTIDSATATVPLRYINSTLGWRLV